MNESRNNSSVSVVTVVKNGERYLAEALQSIIDQTLEPLEILVVDGHSTDRTVEIARSFPGVRVIEQTGRGVGDAYNCGIRAARGEFIAFLSHDDRWTPEKLEVQVGFLLEHPEIQYTLARFTYFLEPGATPPAGFRPEWLEGDRVGKIMETLAARRSVFDRTGGFDPTLSTSEDTDWFARANDLGVTKAVLPDILLHKRIHGGNLSLTTVENNRNLLEALRRSVVRKRRENNDER